MKRLLIAGLGACALTSAVSAQAAQPITGPITPIRLDLETGHVSPGVAWNPAIDVAGTTFANVTSSGFFSPPLVAEEWVDWGVKAGGLTGVACTLEFGYGTDAIDPILGGPGADLEIAIYAGTLGGCTAGDVDTEVRRLSFTGLPGSLDGSSAGYMVEVTLGKDTFLLPDGPIGWSYVGIDGVTGPLLITVGADPTSTIDGFDLYVPAPAVTGFCLGTFPFTSPGVGSFYLRLDEDDGTEPGAQTVRLGTGVNLGVLDLGTAPPKIGAVWDPVMSTDAVAAPVIDFLAMSSVPLPPVVVPGFGELLIGITPPNPIFVLITTPLAGAPFTIPVPLNCNFIGNTLSAQAGQLDISGTFGLTDAIDFTIGI